MYFIQFERNEQRKRTTSLSIVTLLNAVKGTQAENHANRKIKRDNRKEKWKEKEECRKHIAGKMKNSVSGKKSETKAILKRITKSWEGH